MLWQGKSKRWEGRYSDEGSYWLSRFYMIAGYLKGTFGVDTVLVNRTDIGLAAGSFDPYKRLIGCDNRPNPWYKKVATILHEGGHAIDFVKNHHGDADSFLDIAEWYAERSAYFYGWGLITKFNLPITKMHWRKVNVRAMYLVKKHLEFELQRKEYFAYKAEEERRF
jgi:hypothetical protein